MNSDRSNLGIATKFLSDWFEEFRERFAGDTRSQQRPDLQPAAAASIRAKADD